MKMSVDVVLIKPPVVEYTSKMLSLSKYIYGSPPPLGLMYLASALVNNNLKVKIIDAEIENYTIDDCVRETLREKAAIVGVTKEQEIILTVVNMFSGLGIKPFDTIDNANDWLID